MDVIQEAYPNEPAGPLTVLKKAALVAEAERRLSGKWLPAPLRGAPLPAEDGDGDNEPDPSGNGEDEGPAPAEDAAEAEQNPAEPVNSNDEPAENLLAA